MPETNKSIQPKFFTKSLKQYQKDKSSKTSSFFAKLFDVYNSPKTANKIKAKDADAQPDLHVSLHSRDFSDSETTYLNPDTPDDDRLLSQSPVSINISNSDISSLKTPSLSVSDSEDDLSKKADWSADKKQQELVSLSQLLHDAGFQTTNLSSTRRKKRYSIASSENFQVNSHTVHKIKSDAISDKALQGGLFSSKHPVSEPNSPMTDNARRKSEKRPPGLLVDLLQDSKHTRTFSVPAENDTAAKSSASEAEACVAWPKTIALKHSNHQRSISMTHNWAYHSISSGSCFDESEKSFLPMYSAQIVSVQLYKKTEPVEHDSWLDASALARLGDRSASTSIVADKRAQAALSNSLKHFWLSFTGCHIEYEIRVGLFPTGTPSRKMSVLLDCSTDCAADVSNRDEVPIHSRKGSWAIQRRYKEFFDLRESILKSIEGLGDAQVSANLVGLPEFPPKTDLLSNAWLQTDSFYSKLDSFRKTRFTVETIKERRLAFQSLLNYLTSHPVYGTSDALRQFLGD